MAVMIFSVLYISVAEIFNGGFEMSGVASLLVRHTELRSESSGSMGCLGMLHGTIIGRGI